MKARTRTDNPYAVDTLILKAVPWWDADEKRLACSNRVRLELPEHPPRPV